ncbi:MAG: arginine deiminase, partial [Spirochaetales bacterium]|nr:arginine deiminase [Spirochaetales bacterium]
SKKPEELAEIIISGLAISDLPGKAGRSRLSDYINEAFPFYISPLINLYFTRDPGAVIGNRMSISSMKTEARRRESLILHHINKFHPRFADQSDEIWNSHQNPNSIEGGDVLVLSPETVAIGCSVRTSTNAIEEVAESLFKDNGIVKEVLVIQIPFTRAYMHLDTVLTMVDYDKFTIFPGIENSVRVFSLTPGQKSGLIIKPVDNLLTALKSSLKLPSVQLIPSGGGDVITAAREQWNDSTNTLAIAPGVVVTYDRNTVSNDTLRSNGIEVVEIGGSELVRGRGGPRCMSMPLNRDEL